MKPPSEVMSSLLQSKAAYDQTYKTGGSSIKTECEKLVEKNLQAQKTTKGMETELKSLQDKILDLESKLNVTNQPSIP